MIEHITLLGRQWSLHVWWRARQSLLVARGVADGRCSRIASPRFLAYVKASHQWYSLFSPVNLALCKCQKPIAGKTHSREKTFESPGAQGATTRRWKEAYFLHGVPSYFCAVAFRVQLFTHFKMFRQETRSRASLSACQPSADQLQAHESERRNLRAGLSLSKAFRPS